MSKIVKINIGLVLIMAFIVTSITISNYINVAEAKGIKLKVYTDPYNRYTINYPAKWSIQSEPVHTEGILQALNEVPLIFGDNKGSTLSVTELEKSPTLNLREFASTV
ncbi:MAG TPA: hypothetical protein VFI64_03830, partial [Nitrososphaeraceae archaeon]|nr:hypothetical protein [Nitrososphaeraceae archaeon]